MGSGDVSDPLLTAWIL